MYVLTEAGHDGSVEQHPPTDTKQTMPHIDYISFERGHKKNGSAHRTNFDMGGRYKLPHFASFPFVRWAQ